MDWQRALETWGPLAVGVWFLWKVHRDVVYKCIPKGFKQIEQSILKAAKAADVRFAKHVFHLQTLESKIDKAKCRRPETKKRRGRRPQKKPPEKKPPAM